MYLDRNRFDEGDMVNVVRSEHDDPRELIEDVHWGVGYHSLLTEVVEEDKEESSSEVASSGDSDTEISSSDQDVGSMKHPVFACTGIRYR